MENESKISDLAKDLDVVIDKEIGQGTSSIVYKAHPKDSKNKSIYAIKVQKYSPQQGTKHYFNKRFIKEAATLARMRHPGMVQLVTVKEYEDHACIVMDYFDGDTLTQQILQGSLGEEKTVKIISIISGALREAHNLGVAHRDVKPDNILINQLGQAKLIDFGFAVDQQTENKEELKEIVGTFNYSSPEQLGVLKRPVDQRSDLYSLGIILYECLTGELPFKSADVGELAHQHLTKEPAKVSVKNPQISLGISAIVSKLLKKDPDDRYQTCDGLLADLDRLDEINQIIKSNQEPKLGRKDILIKNAQANLFVGRDKELDQLFHAWNQVHVGRGGTIFLEGEPGIGKSRLIREFLHRIQEEKDSKKPMILGAKAEKGEALPFKLLKDLVDFYIRQIVSQKDLTLAQTKAELLDVMGEYAPVLRKFSNQVTKILADANLGDDQIFSQEIFQNAISEFFIKLATKHGSAVLLIDDCQWIDDGTYEVLKKLNLSTLDNKILLIVTGRNDDESVQKVHAIIKEFNSVRKSSAHIVLKPLTHGAVQDLAYQYLNSRDVEAKLAEILDSRCRGNPFMCLEYMHAMLDVGILSPQWSKWTLNQQKMEKLALGSDLIELVLARLNGVRSSTRSILTWAAILGGQFSVDVLSEVCRYSQSDVEMALAEGAQNNLIEKNEIGLFQFVHDRVREALISDVKEDAKKDIHDKITQVLAEKLKKQEEKGLVEDQLVYSLAHHSSLADGKKNSNLIFSSNYQAGRVACKNYANEEAYQYLNKAYEVSIASKVNCDSDFYNLLGQVCMLTFRLHDSVSFFEKALGKTTDRMMRAKIMCLMAQAKQAGWEVSGAWKMINDALDELGKPLPKKMLGRICSTMAFWMGIGLTSFFQKQVNSKKSSSSERVLLVELLNTASEIAVFKHPLLLPISSFRAVFYSAALGDSFEKAQSLATQSLFLKGFKIPGGLNYYTRAMQMAERLNNKTLMGAFNYLWAVGHSIMGDLNGFEKFGREVITRYRNWALPRHYFDMMFSVAWVLQMRGKVDEAIIMAEDVLAQAKSTKNSSAVYPHFTPAYLGALYAIKGRAREGMTLINNLKECLVGRDPNPVLGGDVNSALLATFLEQEDFGAELDSALVRIKEIAPNPMFSFFCMKNAYVSLAYIRLNQALKEMKNKGKNMGKAKEQLQAAFGGLKMATQGAHFYQPHLLAIHASLMMFDGKFAPALKKLIKAEQIARETENDIALYDVLRIKARLFRITGRVGDAATTAQQALDVAQPGSWVNRIKWIEEEFNLKTADKAEGFSKSHTVRVDTTKFGIESLELKRYMDSLLQVSLASATVLDPKEQVKIALDEINRVMGAERAYVFLYNTISKDLDFAGGRNDQKQDLEKLEGYSSTIVNKVRDTKQPIVLTGSDDGEALGSQSAVAFNLKSIMAVPMSLREEFKGIVYIDSKLAKGVFTKNDIGILSSISNHIAIAFETAKLAQLESDKKTLEKDLEIGSSVQNLFFPKNPLKETKAVSLFGLCRPAAQCGGDWWWYDTRKDGSTMVFLGDVTGHGAGPAMITASIAAHYLSLRKNNDMLEIPELIDSLSRQLNEFADGDYLMTGIMVLIDESGKKMNLWSAGGPHVIILGKDGEAKYSSAIGSPMGVSGLTKTGEQEFILNQGDRIVICSDGISETNLPNGRILGDRRIKQLLVEAQSLNPKEAMTDFITKIDKLRGALPQDDDYTIVMADIR